MEKHFKNIDLQIEGNKGKNLFLEHKNVTLKFVDETIKAAAHLKGIDPDLEKELIEYAVEKALHEFCRINQYYTFNSQAKNDLRNIYRSLFSSIKADKSSFETLAANHHQNLKEWLIKTNPFAEKIYSNAEVTIQPVACSEYSAALQIEILNIDCKTLMEPVLDIGCGKQGHLVNQLLQLGIDAYGIDRFSFTEDKLICSDWLEYDYGIEKWGTIISNLGFSNHFKHHDLREDGNYIEYGRKYMEILKSLKFGGSFRYAPDLPFIEQYLDTQQFRIKKITVGESDIKSTILTRLK